MKGQYVFNGLERVVWGEDAVAACAAEADRRKAERVVVITSPSLRRATGTADRIAEDLGPRAMAVFDELVPHTPAPQVAQFASLLVEHKADLVVSLGGGTPIDTAKIALAMLAAGVSDPLQMVERPPMATLPTIRQIACPTTLSGAEFSDLAGLTDPVTRVKHGVASFGIGPASVILDGRLAVETPLKLWLSTGIRALDHAIETLCSIAATPFTDALALEALGKLAHSLRATKRDPANAEARMDAQLGVWLASSGLDRTPYGASHGIGHQLGAIAQIPHGLCSCVLLPAVLEWNQDAVARPQAKIADALGANCAASGARSLLKELGLPTRLSDLGVTHQDIAQIARRSPDNRWVKTNPKPLKSAEDIERLLELAY